MTFFTHNFQIQYVILMVSWTIINVYYQYISFVTLQIELNNNVLDVYNISNYTNCVCLGVF